MTKTVYHSLDEAFAAKKEYPRAEWELEDLLRDEGELFGYERFSRPQWDFNSMEDRAEPPNFGRLDNEDDASWTSRSEGEQKKFIEVLSKNHDRKDDESKKDTLERLDSGHETLKMVLAQISWPINSETQPLEWTSYKAFAQTCYKQYLDLVKGVFESAAYQESPDKPYDPADHVAVFTLGGLKATSRHGEYYARNICERLAKAWANGEHKPTFRKLRSDEHDYSSWEQVQRQKMLATTGVTIQGGLDDFECCYRHYHRLPWELEASLTEEEATIFAENYKPVCGPLAFRNDTNADLTLMDRPLTNSAVSSDRSPAVSGRTTSCGISGSPTGR